MYKRIIALLSGSRHIAEEKLRQVFEILSGGAEWTKHKTEEGAEYAYERAEEGKENAKAKMEL